MCSLFLSARIDSDDYELVNVVNIICSIFNHEKRCTCHLVRAVSGGSATKPLATPTFLATRVVNYFYPGCYVVLSFLLLVVIDVSWKSAVTVVFPF